MSIYINGIGNISAQNTFDNSILKNGIEKLSGNRYCCIEPDYTQFIDGKQIRRMSRVIKMGVASSTLAMRDAGLESPQAIIVGTSLGCMEDTYSFLSKMVQYKEEMLSPTAFIHSTHNSIAAQIALLFQCKVYNSTYVHRNISFESALLDAMLLLEEGSIDNALIGGIDEITNTSFAIMNRLGHFKDSEKVNQENFYFPGKGSVAGEGSAFFALATKQSTNSYAKILSTQTLSFCDPNEITEAAKSMLSENGIDKLDLLLQGNNGDIGDDIIFNEFAESIQMIECKLNFKHLCGEYATASAFGMSIAAQLLRNENTAEKFGYVLTEKPNSILIHNQSNGIHHSLTLLTAC